MPIVRTIAVQHREAVEAGRADRTKFRNQVLKPLIEADLLRMTIPEKPNSRLQKYLLTQKGRAWLSARLTETP